MDQKEWVARMLQKSQQKAEDPKPNITQEDPEEIKKITEGIRWKIQKGK